MNSFETHKSQKNAEVLVDSIPEADQKIDFKSAFMVNPAQNEYDYPSR